MRTNRRGFTLIELIAAVGITALIGYFFISIGRDFIIAWDHVGDSVARETEARGALDTIARDFEAAFFREGSDVMFAVDVLDDSSGSKWESSAVGRPAGDGVDPADHQYGWAGSWIRFFTAAPSFNAVGYRVIRTTIKYGVGTPRYMLYRNAATVENTLSVAEVNGFGLDGDLYLNGDYIVGTTRLNILAVNIVDFGARLYIYDSSGSGDPSGDDAPDGLRLIFPAAGDSTLVSSVVGLTHIGSTFEGTTYGQRYPDVVEIFVRVLSESGADELSDMDEAGDNSRWQEVVDKNSRLYRRYITISGKGGV